MEQTIVDEILSLGTMIRYVGLLDFNGEVLESKMQEEKTSLITRYKTQFLKELPMIIKMLNIQTDMMGKVKRMHVTREKIHHLIWSDDNRILNVSCEGDTDEQKILEISNKIESLINKSNHP